MIGQEDLDAVRARIEEGARDALVLLGTDRRWLTSALEDVLSPEGFRLVRAADADELEAKAGQERPALVIVDEELPGLEVESAARSLVSGPIGGDTPLLLYTSSSAARVRDHVRALDAGFWELLTDPLRPAEVAARLRRMLSISGRMRRAGPRGDGRDEPAGRTARPLEFLGLEELGRVLPTIAAMAERDGTSFSIVLVAPTPSPPGEGEPREEMAATVCGPNLRRADLCARIDDAELAIVAFDTTAEEARALVDRLNTLAAERAEPGRAERRLSAAIVELEPSPALEAALRQLGKRRGDESVSLDEIVDLFHLEDAKSALSDARETGGGVRVIDVA